MIGKVIIFTIEIRVWLASLSFLRSPFMESLTIHLLRVELIHQFDSCATACRRIHWPPLWSNCCNMEVLLFSKSCRRMPALCYLEFRVGTKVVFVPNRWQTVAWRGWRRQGSLMIHPRCLLFIISLFDCQCRVSVEHETCLAYPAHVSNVQRITFLVVTFQEENERESQRKAVGHSW